MNIYLPTIFLILITSNFAQLAKRTVLTSESDGQYSYNRFFVVLTGLPLILVSGLRYRVGTDYWQYAYSYPKYISEFWDSIKTFDEPGIKIIAKISSFIYYDSSTMFFIAAFITVGLCILRISKSSKMFSFSILLYIFIGSWHGSFNGVRQFLAASFIFYGSKYIVERKFKKYLFIVIIAGAFHTSALIMLLLYFLPQKRLNKRQLLILVIISILILSSFNYIIELINNYRYDGKDITQYAYVTKSVSSFRILVAVAPLFIYLFFTNKNSLGKSDFLYVNITIINALFSIVTSNSAYLARFVIYTNVFLVLGYPALLTFKDAKMKLLTKYTILVSYFIYWYYEISLTSNLYVYQWIFSR